MENEEKPKDFNFIVKNAGEDEIARLPPIAFRVPVYVRYKYEPINQKYLENNLKRILGDLLNKIRNILFKLEKRTKTIFKLNFKKLKKGVKNHVKITSMSEMQ